MVLAKAFAILGHIDDILSLLEKFFHSPMILHGRKHWEFPEEEATDFPLEFRVRGWLGHTQLRRTFHCCSKPERAWEDTLLRYMLYSLALSHRALYRDHWNRKPERNLCVDLRISTTLFRSRNPHRNKWSKFVFERDFGHLSRKSSSGQHHNESF